ncbi:MAG: thioredoxin family protein [Myxococcales bacterium]|nr:thioredoxin family protein [Myxococcales bacterium]MDP3501394.1 thioredoxin family protein [Myxococcales bacterium]
MLQLLALALSAAPAHPELGRVAWLRDFDAAVMQAKVTKRPLLVLFDEVPGCETVRGFGRDVLSDSEVVSLVEQHFVAVAVFNNIGGADRKVLEAFGEPTWNNPVVRILDAELKPLAPRFSGPYAREPFLNLLRAAAGLTATPLQTLTMSAHCFWECEARLGRLPAVKSSRVGFLEGAEVVEVVFDSSVLSREALWREASTLECATRVFTRSDAEQAAASQIVGARAFRTDAPLEPSAKDTKFYLKQAGRSEAGLTPTELTRMNAALRFGESAEAARASCQTKPAR